MYICCVCVYVCSDKETRSKRPESRFGMRGVFANSSLDRGSLRSYTSTITEIILYIHRYPCIKRHIYVSHAMRSDFICNKQRGDSCIYMHYLLKEP